MVQVEKQVAVRLLHAAKLVLKNVKMRKCTNVQIWCCAIVGGVNGCYGL